MCSQTLTTVYTISIPSFVVCASNQKFLTSFNFSFLSFSQKILTGTVLRKFRFEMKEIRLRSSPTYDIVCRQSQVGNCHDSTDETVAPRIYPNVTESISPLVTRTAPSLCIENSFAVGPSPNNHLPIMK